MQDPRSNNYKKPIVESFGWKQSQKCLKTMPNGPLVNPKPQIKFQKLEILLKLKSSKNKRSPLEGKWNAMKAKMMSNEEETREKGASVQATREYPPLCLKDNCFS